MFLCSNLECCAAQVNAHFTYLLDLCWLIVEEVSDFVVTWPVRRLQQYCSLSFVVYGKSTVLGYMSKARMDSLQK